MWFQVPIPLTQGRHQSLMAWVIHLSPSINESFKPFRLPTPPSQKKRARNLPWPPIIEMKHDHFCHWNGWFGGTGSSKVRFRITPLGEAPATGRTWFYRFHGHLAFQMRGTGCKSMESIGGFSMVHKVWWMLGFQWETTKSKGHFYKHVRGLQNRHSKINAFTQDGHIRSWFWNQFQASTA